MRKLLLQVVVEMCRKEGRKGKKKLPGWGKLFLF